MSATDRTTSRRRTCHSSRHAPPTKTSCGGSFLRRFPRSELLFELRPLDGLLAHSDRRDEEERARCEPSGLHHRTSSPMMFVGSSAISNSADQRGASSYKGLNDTIAPPSSVPRRRRRSLSETERRAGRRPPQLSTGKVHGAPKLSATGTGTGPSSERRVDLWTSQGGAHLRPEFDTRQPVLAEPRRYRR